MTPTTGTVRFEDGCISVGLERDHFGSVELLAKIDARGLHPFSDRANTEWLFDLLDFCVAYYALDRFIARPSQGWSRPFLINYPVRTERMEVWLSHVGLIREWILALTGDDVQVNPIPWAGVAERYPHPVLGLNEPATSIGLVSDGLDSLCGLHAIKVNDLSRVAFASIISGHRGPRIRNTITSTPGICPDLHFSISLHLRRGNEDKDQTQRSRTILAVVMGLASICA
jgi:hypothetical protein